MKRLIKFKGEEGGTSRGDRTLKIFVLLFILQFLQRRPAKIGLLRLTAALPFIQIAAASGTQPFAILLANRLHRQF